MGRTRLPRTRVSSEKGGSPAMNAGSYTALDATCRTANAAVLYVYLPIPGDHEIPYDPKIVLGVAAQPATRRPVWDS